MVKVDSAVDVKETTPPFDSAGPILLAAVASLILAVAVPVDES